MSIRGLRLSRFLYVVLRAIVIGLIVLGVFAVMGLLVALVAPEQFPVSATISVNDGPPMPLITTATKIWGTLLMLGAVGIAEMLVVPLAGLMESTAGGSPFVAANVRRLNVIAGSFAAYALLMAFGPRLLPAGITGALSWKPGVEFGAILMCVVVLILAEVFRQGVALREDAEGTI